MFLETRDGNSLYAKIYKKDPKDPGANIVGINIGLGLE